MSEECSSQAVSLLFPSNNNHHKKLPAVQNGCRLDKVPLPQLVQGSFFFSCEPPKRTIQVASQSSKVLSDSAFSAEQTGINLFSPILGLRTSLSQDSSSIPSSAAHRATGMQPHGSSACTLQLFAAAATRSLSHMCIPYMT